MATQQHVPTAHGIIILSIVALIVGGGVVYLLNQRLVAVTNNLQAQIDEVRKQVNSDKATPPPSGSTTQTFNEQYFSIQTPNGWFKKTPSSRNETGTQDFYYEDGKGNYYSIGVDPVGRGVHVDSTWEIEINSAGTGYVISSQGEQCKSSDDPYCTYGDSRLDILISDTEFTMLKGHNYVFFAGNTKQETGVDLQVFRDILLSFKAK